MVVDIPEHALGALYDRVVTGSSLGNRDLQQTQKIKDLKAGSKTWANPK
jgi:hypothetical protein